MFFLRSSSVRVVKVNLFNLRERYGSQGPRRTGGVQKTQESLKGCCDPKAERQGRNSKQINVCGPSHSCLRLNNGSC